jgi:hypothetical protein
MKVSLRTNIIAENTLHTIAELEVDLPFAPSADTAIGQSAWEEPRTPTSLMYDIDDKILILMFHAEKLDSKEKADELAARYKRCGWKVE